MKKRILTAGITMVVLVLGVLVLTKLHAQKTNQGLTLHPSNFDVSLSLGTPYTGIVYVDNHSDVNVPVTVLVRNFTAQGEEGGVDITTKDTTYSLAKWVNISPTTATIPAKGTQKFTFTITAPVGAEPGGHFGSLVFKTVPSSNLQGSGAVVSQELASLILARTPGEAKEDAVVESLTTDKQFYEFGPVNFTLRVKNNGNVHIQPFGAIQVTDMFGRKFDVPLVPTNVLPDAIRRIPATLQHRILIGKYTARVIAGYGTRNQQLVASAEFYAFPIRYGVLVFLILVVLFLLRKRLWKSFKILVMNK